MGVAGLRIGRAAAPLLLVVLLLGALVIAGCGGSSESGDSAATTADAGLRVEVTPARAPAGTTVKARVVNDSEEEFTYGLDYVLQRQEGDSFVKVSEPRSMLLIGLVAKPGGTGPPVTVRIPGDALPGQYRVVIQRDVPDVGDLSGEFTVIDDH